MNRFYLDSNVYRIVDESHPGHKPGLRQFMEELKDKVLFIFSDAHLDDLKDSIQPYLDKDLALMGHFTGDNYLFRDPIKNETRCFRMTPAQAFGSKDYRAYNEAVANPFDFDRLFAELDNTNEGKALRKLIDSMLDLPITSFGEKIQTEGLTGDHKVMFDKAFPGYRPEMSLREFLASIGPLASSLLTQPKELADMRKYIDSYMTREDYSYDVWGMEFDQQFKESTYGKSFLEVIDAMMLESQRKDSYRRFQYIYNLLEMFGITRERSSKKNTLTSLGNDASHTYFGSLCDYLITDDQGMLIKANIIFRLLYIPTRVMTSSEFLNMKTILLAQEETWGSFKDSLVHDLRHAMQLSVEMNFEAGELEKLFKTGHSYFNFFSRLAMYTRDGKSFQALFHERNTDPSFIMVREIELLVAKLLKLFGPDDESKGQFCLDEKTDPEIPLRKWTMEELIFKVTFWHRGGVPTMFLAFTIRGDQNVY